MNLSKIRLFSAFIFPGWLLLLLPALIPLFRPGLFVSIDGRFHVYRIAALADAWREGVLHPRLFPEFGFGYGQAVLNFYSPLSYWPGALLSLLGMSPTVAFQWTIGLGFVLAGLAAFGYVRSLWGERAGILAALVYTYLPYHLADAYSRGALAEHMAFVFPPLILWAYTATFRQREWRMPLLWGSLAWVGLVLTHNLTTLLMALAAIPHLLWLAFCTRRWERLLEAGLSLLLAMGISAGYWLPVLAESQAVGIGSTASQGFVDHLLGLGALLSFSWPYPYGDANGWAAVYPLSWLTPLLLVLGTAALALRPHLTAVQVVSAGSADDGTLRTGQMWMGAFHLALAVAAIGMTTTLSLPLWLPLTPLLGHLQYPWRFLLLEAVGLMGCVALLPRLWPRLPGWAWALGMTALLALVSLPGLPSLPLELSTAQVWSPQRMWQEDAESGQVGATWTGEFLPVTVTEQRWALGRARAGATDTPPLDPPPAVRVESVGFGRMAVGVESALPFDLRLHQFAQPGWNATIDGISMPLTASGEMGLVTTMVEAGRNRVEFWYGPTPARRVSTGLALLSVALWAILGWRRLRVAALLLVAGALLLALNGLGIGAMTRTPLPVQVRLGDTALLIGYETSSARGERALDVTLYWFALRETSVNLNAFVHLLGADGAVIAQHDGAPVGGFTPTTRWRPGEIVADTHRIPLSPEVGPGVYGLKAGLYDPATVTNLPVDPPTPDNRVELGTVTATR